MGQTQLPHNPSHQPSTLDAAKFYARQAWRVFPIKPGRKEPAFTGWQQSASTDPRQLAQWFGNGSRFNIAVLTGQPSRLFVLDVDPRNGGEASLEDLQARIGKLSGTVMQLTPGSGYHFLFRLPDHMDIRSLKLPDFPGIDIKGTGGFVLVPPSQVGGRSYVWEESSRPGEIPMAEAPAGLLELLQRKFRFEALEAMESISEGERNNTLISHAGKLRSMGWGYAEILAALLALNKKRCDPPLPDREVEHIARSAASYEPGKLHVTAVDRMTPRNLKCTDYGNSERLIAYHGEDLRHCPQLNRWFVWNGAVWQPDPGNLVMARAMDTVRRIYGEAGGLDDEKERKKHGQHAVGSERVERLNAMVSLARHLPGIAVHPGDLDANPHLLNVMNGTLDLWTFDLREHRREDLITRLAPVPYDQAAKCPVWQKFLIDIFDGNEEMIRYIQRVLGLCLSGETTARAIFILHGSGHNGKTTLLETARDVLGDYAETIPPEELMQVRRADRGRASPDLAKLPGKRFVTAMETEENQRLAAALVKAMTGGRDVISARDLYGKPFSFRPQFKLLIGTNHRPRINDATSSIWGRVHLIPFLVQIPDPERGEEPDVKGRVKDPKLDNKLGAELGGILAWMVRGWREYRPHGLNPPPEVLEAIRQYREQEDVVGQFMDDGLEFGVGLEATVKDLKAALAEWCALNGLNVEWRAVANRLMERGDVNTGKVKGERGWRGVCHRCG